MLGSLLEKGEEMRRWVVGFSLAAMWVEAWGVLPTDGEGERCGIMHGGFRWRVSVVVILLVVLGREREREMGWVCCWIA